MALISCPECGREVSDKADSCPQYTTTDDRKRNPEELTFTPQNSHKASDIKRPAIIVAVVIGIAIVVIVSFLSLKSKNSTEQPSETLTESQIRSDLQGLWTTYADESSFVFSGSNISYEYLYAPSMELVQCEGTYEIDMEKRRVKSQTSIKFDEDAEYIPLISIRYDDAGNVTLVAGGNTYVKGEAPQKSR